MLKVKLLNCYPPNSYYKICMQWIVKEVCKYDTICYEIKVQRVKTQTFLERVRKANEENQLFLDKFSDPYSIFEASKPDQD
jgi:hypothetical protein